MLTRGQILDHVWDYDFGGDARVLETYVSYLRKKLDAHGPSLIHTVRGVGYALRPPRAEAPALAAGAPARGDDRRSPRPSASSLLAAITYAQQRDFLIEHVDDQVDVRAAAGARERARSSASCSGTGGDGGDRGPPRRRPPPGEVNLPPGTYGERRDADGGRASASRSSSATSDETAAAPELPADMRAGRDDHRRRPRTAATRYRVARRADPRRRRA